MKKIKTPKRSPIKRRAKPAVPKEIKAHWDQIARLGCVICAEQATIHHIHGRELTSLGLGRGMGQKTSVWLCIPLCVAHHVGDFGIDGSMGVTRWESVYGSQMHLLGKLSATIGIDLLEKARADRAA